MSAYEGSKMQENDENRKQKFLGHVKNNKIEFKDPKLNPKTVQDFLANFLLANGFKKIEKHHYANDMCGVVLTDTNIEVASNNGHVMYSVDQNIYWLIGNLTYRGFIPMVYNKTF